MVERTQLFDCQRPFQGHSVSSISSFLTCTDVGGWLKDTPSLLHIQDGLQ
ncbi:Hypothetical protein FKW44_003256 [Caligus rogercresseyi]|uniref:Uncharacterized protein n=1 Tax=Caligus rogercresseyi TaxID=217165 RepID=A0A7T8KLE0_CALRO|nr:Hypothetical protein FKW44_003256 [Caligus rogercresseyi]